MISNCVINLAPDKPAVFREIVRVLKPGGRLAVSDIALKKPLPPELGSDLMAYVGCIAGAIPVEDYRRGLIEAGFAARGHHRHGSRPERLRQGGEPVGLLLASASNTADPRVPRKPAVAAVPRPTENESLHQRLAVLLRRYDVNEYAASVRVFAVKPP